MNITRLAASLILSIVPSATIAAQSISISNLLFHNDGVQEGFSRGPGLTTVPLTVIQRFPEEQWCGRTCLECVTIEFEDLSPASPETFTIEVRQGTGPANSPTDAPDMTPTGLLGPPIVAVKPPGPATHKQSVVIRPCYNLPFGFDTYICVTLPPPGDLQVWFSSPEAHRPAPARYGPALDVALAWVYDASLVPPPKTTFVATLGSNWSWAIGASLDEDVCQAFGEGPAPVGLKNYGYVGIYPDMPNPRLDQVGWRLRTSYPAGSPCVLIIGFSCLTFSINTGIFGPGWTGYLCVDHLLAVPGVTSGLAVPCVSISEAVIGPVGCPSCPPLDICAQFATIPIAPGPIRMSTACVIDM